MISSKKVTKPCHGELQMPTNALLTMLLHPALQKESLGRKEKDKQTQRQSIHTKTKYSSGASIQNSCDAITKPATCFRDKDKIKKWLSARVTPSV